LQPHIDAVICHAHSSHSEARNLEVDHAHPVEDQPVPVV
jgi:hypothetical protein